MPHHKQFAISQETELVYKELAESLGMWTAKEELSDLAFQYTEPEKYAQIGEEIDHDPRMNPECYIHFTSKIEALFGVSGIGCRTLVRFKGRHSTHLKRERKVFAGECSPHDLRGINDLVSIGVVVQSRADCYLALEKLHNDWDGVILTDSLKDCIASPAENGYQALQTTIMTADGPIEIAIMTEEMKAFNDLGVAYTLSRNHDSKPSQLKPVFLPSGRAMFMPPQSTGVDLMVRQDISLALQKPKLIVDGKVVPITSVIPVGSIAEVLPTTDEPTHLEEALLKYCSDASERKLRTLQLSAQEYELRNTGAAMLESILMPRGLLTLEDLGGKLVHEIVRRVDRKANRVKSKEQLYHLLGGGFIESQQVTQVLDELGVTKENLNFSTVQVKGAVDRPGILDALAGQISARGGNIKDIHTDTENGFTVRIVVKGLTGESEQELCDFLMKDELFTQVVVV